MSPCRLNLLPVVVVCLFVACTQRPIDVVPETTGQQWQRVVELRESSSGRVPELWASGSSDVYVWTAASAPGLQHYDGIEWNDVPLENATFVTDIAGSGPADVYVASGTLRHFNGVSWSDTGVPAASISASSPDNVVVGQWDSVLRFNGADWDTLWTRTDSQGARDVAAYGTDGAYAAVWDSLLHWEGGSRTASQASGRIIVVHALSDGTCLVGGNRADGYPGVYAFNGGWMSLDFPADYGFPYYLWGTSQSSVWVAASNGKLLRFDGVSWNLESTATNSTVFPVWGTGDTDVYAAGLNGAVTHYDGAVWGLLRSGTPSSIRTITAESPTDFRVGESQGTVYHYLDGEWTEEALPGEDNLVLALAAHGTNRYAGTGSGRVYHGDGSGWTLVADSLSSSYPEAVYDLAVAADGSAFAVGWGGVNVFDGVSWKRFELGQVLLTHVWAMSRSVAFATSFESVFEFDGAEWRKVLEGKLASYAGVWGTSRSNVYVVSHDGIFHYDGSQWRVDMPNYAYTWITGTAPDDVVAFGDYGVARFDGAVWRADGEDRIQALDLTVSNTGHIMRLYRRYDANSRSSTVIAWRVRVP